MKRGTVIGVLAALVGLTLTACTNQPVDAPGGVEPSASATTEVTTTKATTTTGATTVDVAVSQYSVFFHPVANEEARAAVEELVVESGAEVTVLDQTEIYSEFQDFYADKPALIRDVSIEDMPPALRVKPDTPLSDELRDAIESNPAVRALVTVEDALRSLELDTRRARDPRSELSIVYMWPSSDGSERSGPKAHKAVREILAEVPGVYFVDQDATFSEFKAFFDGDDDVVLKDFTAEMMPPSWRVDLGGEPLPETTRAELEESIYVRTVVDATQ